MAHTCDAAIVTCIDFRFQKFIEDWTGKNLGELNYDKISLAGAVFDSAYVLKQLVISNRLHHIKKVILVNHDNCGAYGAAGTYERHSQDLNNIKVEINRIYPHLKVETYFMYLDGKIEKIK